MTSFFLRFATAITVLLAVESVGKAQGVAPRAQPVSPGYGSPAGGFGTQPGSGDRMEVVDPDKKLSAGDRVTVEIVEDKEGGLPRIVTATGDLDVFPLGRVHVAGKTTLEACLDIKRKLEGEYYHHATVRLSIDAVSPVKVKSGMVYLSGEVRQVGPQDIITGETLTLSNAILRAGNFTDWANQRKVQLTRKNGTSTTSTIYDVKSIIQTGNINGDPVLQDGDRVYVFKLIFRG